MEENYTIAEEYILPSSGKIYEKAFDPHVKLRSMTTMEEMRRNSTSSTPNRVLAEIIDDCLITKLPVKAYDMAWGDFEYLLHKLRIVTYGPSYKFTVGCPHCGNLYESTMSLDDLTVKDFDVNAFNDSLVCRLPVCGKEVKLKYQTPRLLDEITQQAKDFKRKNKVDYDPTSLITLQLMIDTIDGVKYDYVSLEGFIEKLSARDLNFILKRIQKSNNMIGLNKEIILTCKNNKCGQEIYTFFRLNPEFFEPSEDC